MPTPPKVPSDGDEWFYKTGLIAGIIITVLVVVAMVLGIIWLAQQVF